MGQTVLWDGFTIVHFMFTVLKFSVGLGCHLLVSNKTSLSLKWKYIFLCASHRLAENNRIMGFEPCCSLTGGTSNSLTHTYVFIHF